MQKMGWNKFFLLAPTETIQSKMTLTRQFRAFKEEMKRREKLGGQLTFEDL